MDTQEMVIMEYKKEITAADRELVKQDHQIIGEVVVETSDNNGQAVEQPHNQGAPNQHHQTAARHPPPPPPAPQQQQQHLAKGVPVTAPAIRQAHPEHTPANRPQQWVPKDEGEERVGLASAQPITVITAPKTRMINSSGNISEMTAEESEASERGYTEMINHQGHVVESNGVGGNGGTNSSHPYSGAETLPTTTSATTVSNMPQLLAPSREINNEKDQICIGNQILTHPEHSSTTIYHEQVHAGEGETGYRNEYYSQYSDQRGEHTTILNRDGQPVTMASNYVNTYRYAGSPGRVVTTTTELKPIQMDEQQQQQQQEIHIYDETGEVVQNGSHNGMDSKLHYTNLDGNYISQEHYSTAYAAPGNPAIGKGEYIFGPHGNVLYKSAEINRNFTDAILASHHRQQYLYTPIPIGQAIYESPSSASAGGPSPSGQPPRFHSNQPPPFYNFDSYAQVAIENDPSDYQTSWTTAGGGAYEEHGPLTATITTTVNHAVTKCVHCGSQNASHYRSDASGHLICGNCSVRSGVPAPPTSRPPNRSAKAKTAQATVNNNRRTGVVCANCNTTTTTLWRRNNSGDPVCNACGLYFKLHNTPRPIAMKKDGVQTRKRKPKNVPNNGTGAKKVLPSMTIPQPDPKLLQPGPVEMSEVSAVSAGQEPPPTQHYMPAHSQSGGSLPMGYVVRPMRHASPASGAVDTSRSGVAETTSVITSTGAPSGP